MSVYIPGMEMPKACIACPFAQYWSEPTTLADDSMFQNVFIICWRTRSKIQNETSRNDDCPLVPVPEHGRLIDKDVICKECRRVAEEYDGIYPDCTHCPVNLAPAIIPAEEGEG